MNSKNKNSNKTHWGEVADWYDGVVNDDNSYQTKVIMPNLKRILLENNKLKDLKGKKVIDVACGQGYFSEMIKNLGAEVIAFDLGSDLIKLAIKNDESKNENLIDKIHNKSIKYYVADAQDFVNVLIKEEKTFKKESYDIAICILALQNIENIKKVFDEVSKSLKVGGRFIFVINHPAFRIPQNSDWYFDNHKTLNARKVDMYMTETKIKMDMHPGQRNKKLKEYTYSFHRPIQDYFKNLSNSGFVVDRLEEWISHKESEEGPKKAIEDKARKEFPMFVCIESVKK